MCSYSCLVTAKDFLKAKEVLQVNLPFAILFQCAYIFMNALNYINRLSFTSSAVSASLSWLSDMIQCALVINASVN